MSLENFQSVLKDRYEQEDNRNKQIESKTHHLLFLTTVIVPLTKFFKIDFDWIVIIPTIIMVILFILVLKLREFQRPIDPDYFITKDNTINQDLLKKSMDLTPEEFSKDRIESYIRCASQNKKLVDRKAFYLRLMQVVIVIQIVLLVSILLYGNLDSSILNNDLINFGNFTSDG